MNFKKKCFATSGGLHSTGITTGHQRIYHRSSDLLEEQIALWPHRLLPLDRNVTGLEGQVGVAGLEVYSRLEGDF